MKERVVYGENQKKVRCEVQTRDLPSDFSWNLCKRDLSGTSAASPDCAALDDQVPTGGVSREGLSQGKGSRKTSRKAPCKDRPDGSGNRPFKKIPRDAQTPEKRRYINHHWKEFGSVSRACEQVGLPSSTYYYKPVIDPRKKAQRDTELRDQIEHIQEEFPAYGVRQIYWEFLRVYNMRINRKRIARVMKKYGLKAQIFRGFRIPTTDSNHKNLIYPNLLHGKEVTKLDQVWVADITYVRLQTGFVYFAGIMDLLGRKIIGWSISKEIHSKLCVEALKMAIQSRSPGSGCIHHSDRGVQYASHEYTDLLKENGFLISMSRKGNCWDNSFIESFFSTLKREEVHLNEYENIRDVIARIPCFIEEVYNTKRRHSSLKGLSPVEFEAKWRSGELQKMGIPYVIKLWDGFSK